VFVNALERFLKNCEINKIHSWPKLNSSKGNMKSLCAIKKKDFVAGCSYHYHEHYHYHF